MEPRAGSELKVHKCDFVAILRLRLFYAGPAFSRKLHPVDGGLITGTKPKSTCILLQIANKKEMRIVRVCGDLTKKALREFEEDEEFYRQIRDSLLKEKKGKWVAVHGRKVVASADSLNSLLKLTFEIVDGPCYLNKVGEEQAVGRRVYRLRLIL